MNSWLSGNYSAAARKTPISFLLFLELRRVSVTTILRKMPSVWVTLLSQRKGQGW